jgi:hypothetical protein
MSYSFRSIIDGGADSEMIYYNATMTSSKTADLTISQPPQPVKFNETRDAPIIKDASQYNFSIIKFTMNGPGRELPLFIPLIQTNGTVTTTGLQIDPNQTIYNLATAYQRVWNYTNNAGAAATAIITLAPQSTPIQYIPEIQNRTLAPVPQVPVTGIAKQDLSTRYYWVYTYTHFATLVNNALYQSYVNLWTAFQAAWAALPTAQPSPYTGVTTQAGINSFILDHDVPFIKYNEFTKLFEIYGDTRAFNISGSLVSGPPLPGRYGTPQGTQQSVPAFVPPAYVATDPPSAATQPYLRLFFNTELMNLLANFPNMFYGAVGGSTLLFPLPVTTSPNVFSITLGNSSTFSGVGPWLYSYEILFANQLYTNILNNNPLLQGNPAVPPPAYNPFYLIPTDRQNLYWKVVQDYRSTDAMWSPVASIVFTSAMLPIKKEYNSANVDLNAGNLGGGSTGSQSSFQPIITDFSIDQQLEGAEGYRNFTQYEPTAEYRMISMTASHEEIRNIDIQVFWKYRLTGELIPLTAANCSDINIKMLFRKTDYRS